MRDRLIELLKSGIRALESQCGARTYDDLADHLLTNGVIVPPCKVGDTVFVVSQGAGFSVVWNVYKATAKAIHLDQWGKLFVRVETEKENVGGYVEIDRLYLTKEEAEKALERSGK